MIEHPKFHSTVEVVTKPSNDEKRPDARTPSISDETWKPIEMMIAPTYDAGHEQSVSAR